MYRHGRTQWNLDKRIQGKTDTELSVAGMAALSNTVLPDELFQCAWYCSPLRRATQSARLLGCKNFTEDERLSEMDWGEWEGKRLTDLRARFGETMALNEARGLDFQPTGGESPRDVCERVMAWLQDVGRQGEPVVAVTHKGVIRAALSLATGWTMMKKPPVRLHWDAGQLFRFDPNDATLSLVKANIVFVRGHGHAQ